MSLEQQLLEALEKSTNEREIQRFLKENIFLITSLNEHVSNFVECIPEFRFGCDYVADYLILSANSGWWNAIFIEPPVLG